MIPAIVVVVAAAVAAVEDRGAIEEAVLMGMLYIFVRHLIF